MELSEAIREGAALRPQVFGASFALLPSGKMGSSALGAAMEVVDADTQEALAAGKIPRTVHAVGIVLRFPKVMDLSLDLPKVCPQCSARHSSFLVLVNHLNDVHHADREGVANWLEELGL